MRALNNSRGAQGPQNPSQDGRDCSSLQVRQPKLRSCKEKGTNPPGSHFQTPEVDKGGREQPA